MRHRSAKLSFRFMFFMVIYQIFTTIFMLLPPMLGAIFCAIALNIDKEDKKDQKNIYLAFAYLVFIECLHNFYVFSSMLGFFLFYYNLAGWIRTSFKLHNLLLVIYVFCGYAFTLLTNIFLAYVFNDYFMGFSWVYVYYALIESVVCIVLFRDYIL